MGRFAVEGDEDEQDEEGEGGTYAGLSIRDEPDEDLEDDEGSEDLGGEEAEASDDVRIKPIEGGPMANHNGSRFHATQSNDYLVPLMVPKQHYAQMVQQLALLVRDAPDSPTPANGLVLRAIEVMRADRAKWLTFKELCRAVDTKPVKLRNAMSAYNRRANLDNTRAEYVTKMISGQMYYKYAGA